MNGEMTEERESWELCDACAEPARSPACARCPLGQLKMQVAGRRIDCRAAAVARRLEQMLGFHNAAVPRQERC